MTVKLAILETGEEIIADIKEGVIEDKVVTYIFDNPCKVILQGSYKILSDDEEPIDRMSISLSHWPTLSEDDVVLVSTNSIITVVEPKSELKKMYVEQVLKNGNEIDKNTGVDEQSDSDKSD